MKGDEQDHRNKRLKTSNGSFESIPFDLTVEILTKVPVKSLMKFQYVSKTWCSIIRSKDFHKSLVSLSSTPPSQLLITFRNGQVTNTDAEKSLFLFTSSQEEDEESSTLVANLDMRMASMDAYFRTRGTSLNGFVCLSHKGYDPVNDQYKALSKRLSNFTGGQEHMVFTIGGDNSSSWRHIKGTTHKYTPLTKGICINGFVYYGASIQTAGMDKVIVCFDVRSEKLSFIKLPWTHNVDVDWSGTSNLINYEGKLANAKVNPDTIRLWVLQDAEKHQWFTRAYDFRKSWWDSDEKIPMRVHGTNNKGDIIIAPKYLSRITEPFYIYYVGIYGTSEITLQGIADDDDFRSRYGIGKNGRCYVYISPDHVANYTFL